MSTPLLTNPTSSIASAHYFRQPCLRTMSRSEEKRRERKQRRKEKAKERRSQNNHHVEAAAREKKNLKQDEGNNIEQSDEESDSDLLEAAQKWAEDSRKSIPGKEHSDEPSALTVTAKGAVGSLSLHITQLAFDTSDYDIRNFFVSNGVTVTSVRLVYDGSGLQKTFRGVAFVDVADTASFEKAIKLHRSVLRGRRINVRPTRSREELAAIVARRPPLFHTTSSSDGERPRPASSDHEATKDKSDRKRNRKRKLDVETSSTSTDKSKQIKIRKQPTKKLTKKERNRRAAIIQSKSPKG